jgi:hypothetical protein
LNLDFMGTAEKWTFPKSGYPELLQIGEENEDHVPFRDAQHPHSSPVMGLTISDTISLQNEKDHIKVWFAPRGQSTDGPVAFMHRPTGMQNPDAPLGHHIGQDVGHITSTVIGAQLHLSQSNLEISSFHGEEPEPTEVDLPIGSPNSFAARFTQQLNPHFYAMASAAYVKHPETHATGPDHIWRYSASAYNDFSFENGWMLHNTLIWGMVKNYDEASTLHSFGEEFWFHKGPANIWSRLELLQRTPAELAISGYGDENKGRWVTAATLGYTHTLASWEGLNLGLGGSVTKDFLPEGFRAAYGGNPWSGRVFLRLNGMKMWEL